MDTLAVYVAANIYRTYTASKYITFASHSCLLINERDEKRISRIWDDTEFAQGWRRPEEKGKGDLVEATCAGSSSRKVIDALWRFELGANNFSPDRSSNIERTLCAQVRLGSKRCARATCRRIRRWTVSYTAGRAVKSEIERFRQVRVI